MVQTSTLAHRSFGDIGFRDVCFLLNTMELDGTRFLVPSHSITQRRQTSLQPISPKHDNPNANTTDGGWIVV